MNLALVRSRRVQLGLVTVLTIVLVAADVVFQREWVATDPSDPPAIHRAAADGRRPRRRRGGLPPPGAPGGAGMDVHARAGVQGRR